MAAESVSKPCGTRHPRGELWTQVGGRQLAPLELRVDAGRARQGATYIEPRASPAPDPSGSTAPDACTLSFRLKDSHFNPRRPLKADSGVKVMSHMDLRHEQARQLIDVEQAFEAYRAARVEHDARYAGSMSWKRINGDDYLYRKVKGSNRSLGPMSEATRATHSAFHSGRERIRGRMSGLAGRLDEMAPVNRALGLARVPKTGARVLRSLAVAGLMGKAIDIVGTNALFAYERMAAVQVESGLLATGDTDLLFDSRRSLKLISSDIGAGGLLGLLRKADPSFSLTGPRSFRAVNDGGFMVDLIKPIPKNALSTTERSTLGGEDDMHAVELEGLKWLVNSPKQRVVVIDERGYPLEVSVPDPRSFAIHKAWLSSRADREPIKCKRDGGQATLVAELVKERLPHLRFDAHDLTALPAAICSSAASILDAASPSKDTDRTRMEPDW